MESSQRRSAWLGLLSGVLLIVGVGGYLGYRIWWHSDTVQNEPVDPGESRRREKIPVPKIWFTDVTKESGIAFRHVNGDSGKRLLPETMGGGVVVLDVNADSQPDLLFVNSCQWPGYEGDDPAPTHRCYLNDGNFSFRDVTTAVGLDITMYGMGATAGDYDNDGFMDLFITGVGGSRLFHNEDGGPLGRRFVEKPPSESGVGGPHDWPNELTREEFLNDDIPISFPSSAAFVDYDGDALLDLFVCHYVTWSPAIDLSIEASLTGEKRSFVQPTEFRGSNCVLYHNLGGGQFKDVSASRGVAMERAIGKSLGVLVCDPDKDGWPDLVVANDTVRNFFFHNVPDPDGGRRFSEEGERSGIAYVGSKARGGMGIDAAEYRPGEYAVVIANFANEPVSFLRLNPRRGSRLLFSDKAFNVGLYGPSRELLKFGTFFFDYDLDGSSDLLMANGHLEPAISQLQANQTYEQPVQLFWNTGEEVRCFEPVTAENAGEDLFEPMVGRGCAYADFDGDGDLDVVLVGNNGPARLVRNDNDRGHHWLRIKLTGDGTQVNLSAIGARIELTSVGQTQTRYVASSRGYLSQSELVQTFGLGNHDTIDEIKVIWPGGTRPPTVLRDVEVDRVLEVDQGSDEQ